MLDKATASKSATASSPDRISLKQRVLSAGAWSLAGFGLSQVLRFGSNLVMTRLLVPEMFGVMAIAATVMVALAMFSDLGLKQNVVQSGRGHDPAFLNTAWVMQIFRGLVLWLGASCIALLLYLANRAGLVPKDTVYADPILPWVVAVLSTTAVIVGFQSTKMYEASRNLALRHITKIEVIAQVAGLSCMITWAIIDRSIWALVAGGLCSSLVSVGLAHLWLPGTPNRWQWDRSAAQEIYHFGKWIFAASIFGFLVNNGDRLLLGGLVDPTTLGIYVIAFLIFNSIEQTLARMIGEIAFPALSEVARERPADVSRVYYGFHIPIASFTYFCAGSLIILAQPLVDLFYDRRYGQAGWMLELLAVALLSAPLKTAVQCFLALGMPRALSNIIVIRLAALAVLLPVGFYWLGMPGALWGIVLSHFSYVPTIVLLSRRHGLLDCRKELLLLIFVPVGMGVAQLLSVGIGYLR